MWEDQIIRKYVTGTQFVCRLWRDVDEVADELLSIGDIITANDWNTERHITVTFHPRPEWTDGNRGTRFRFDGVYGDVPPPITRHTQAPEGSRRSSHRALLLRPAAAGASRRGAAFFLQRARHPHRRRPCRHSGRGVSTWPCLRISSSAADLQKPGTSA